MTGSGMRERVSDRARERESVCEKESKRESVCVYGKVLHTFYVILSCYDKQMHTPTHTRTHALTK